MRGKFARLVSIGVGLCGTALGLGLVLGGPLTNQGSQAPLTKPLISPSQCAGCHGTNYDPPNHIEPHDTWAGSMMAQASRDPLFWAALDVANNDVPGMGDFCIRCHVPQGWLAGRSEPPGGTVDGCGLIGNIDTTTGATDLEGVTCHLCHRMMINPSPPAGQQSVYLENGQYWVDDVACAGSSQPCRRGPYDYTANGWNPPPGGAIGHPWMYSAYHTTSDLCGNCHNVTNPVKNLIVNGVDAGIKFPIERTHKEWTQSAYSVAGANFKTCQNCHMPDTTANPAYACSQFSNNHTNDMPVHRFAGGNSWVPEVLRVSYPGLNLDTQLAATRDAALDMLQNQSALVEMTYPAEALLGGALDIAVKVTNLTGHKLPTGYPEGRRMWLHVEAKDGTNAVFWESGAYNAATGVLTHDAALKLYEIKPGVWNFNGGNTCDTVDGSASPIFHFALNDCLVKDNRIPPLGFTGGTHLETRPVGYTYPETAPGSGTLVNYDVTNYSIPIPPGTPSPVAVTATLRYQTVSKEYVEFLLDQAIDNNFPDDCIDRSTGPATASRGEILHGMWSQNGKAAPVAMDSAWGAVPLFAPTPGEASGPGGVQLRVTDYDAGTGQLSFTYDPACGATDHTVYAGNLATVSTMVFSQQVCARGTSGTTSFAPGSGNVFFVIVGNDGGKEGSYGTDDNGNERPENTSLASCNVPQDLAHRCD